MATACVNGQTGKPKIRYLTAEEAAKFATGSMHVYLCDSCECFHVGHPPRSSVRQKKKRKKYQFNKYPKRPRY